MYVVNVCVGSFKLLLRPLSVLLFLFLFAVIFGRVINTFRAALRPFCFIPGISSTSMCLPDPPTVIGSLKQARNKGPQWADYPKLVDVQNSFERLLDDSVGGSGLALDVKKAEMATSDLVVLVRFSELTSKDLLGMIVLCFIRARRADVNDSSRVSD